MKKKQKLYQNFPSILLFLLLFSIILAACSKDPDTSQEPGLEETFGLISEISASGEVVPIEWTTLSFSNVAEDVEVLVNEGDQVLKGDILIRNKDTRLVAALFQAQAAVERAKYAYEQTLNAPSDAALKSAYSAFITARINLKQQEENETSDDLITIAQADFDAARANFDAVSTGSSNQEISAAANDLRSAELALEDAEAALIIKAPFNGNIVEIFTNSGETIGAFQPVITMADLSIFEVITTDLSEVDVPPLEVGQKANIIFDALSDQTFSGTIQKIAEKSTGVASVYYEVTLSLDEIPENLRWGMTAFITFPLE